MILRPVIVVFALLACMIMSAGSILQRIDSGTIISVPGSFLIVGFVLSLLVGMGIIVTFHPFRWDEPSSLI